MHSLHLKDTRNFKSENGFSPDFLWWSLRFAWARANVCRKSEKTRLNISHALSFHVLWHNSEGAKWLTVVHKDQSELIFGPAILKLRRVGTFVLWKQLIEDYFHQTFRLVKRDLAVLPKRNNSKQTDMSPYRHQTNKYKEAGFINDNVYS